MTPCIPWTGAMHHKGYGQYAHRPAHRVVYERANGPVPAGMVLDHVCHNADESCPGGPPCPHRRCVNLEHLEVVTPALNTLRGRSPSARNARKVACPAGHPYDETNTYRGINSRSGRMARVCKVCQRAKTARYIARRRAVGA